MENISPKVIKLFKPAGYTSYDCIRFIKNQFPKNNRPKIGHFGTLDPFACGLLLVGIGAGAKLNDYIHSSFSKTYLAVGKIGLKTDSGDFTGETIATDNTEYLKNVIANYSVDFISKSLTDKFLGEYMQSPPKFSASKFQGKPLHQWARDGVEIKKEAVKREILRIDVLKYSFPYISIRFEVSSGTYIRTLFEECCEWLGSVGTLVSLVREKIGPHSYQDAMRFSPKSDKKIDNLDSFSMSIDQALILEKVHLAGQHAKHYKNGLSRKGLSLNFEGLCWVYEENLLLGMGKYYNNELMVVFNLWSPQ